MSRKILLGPYVGSNSKCIMWASLSRRQVRTEWANDKAQVITTTLTCWILMNHLVLLREKSMSMERLDGSDYILPTLACMNQWGSQLHLPVQELGRWRKRSKKCSRCHNKRTERRRGETSIDYINKEGLVWALVLTHEWSTLDFRYRVGRRNANDIRTPSTQWEAWGTKTTWLLKSNYSQWSIDVEQAAPRPMHGWCSRNLKSSVHSLNFFTFASLDCEI